MPEKIDIVLVKHVLYVHIPALAKTVSAGKEWLKFDSGDGVEELDQRRRIRLSSRA